MQDFSLKIEKITGQAKDSKLCRYLLEEYYFREGLTGG